MDRDSSLATWRALALRMEDEVGRATIGVARTVRLINVAVFARGHVLLEGDVGIGKTTLLRAFARAIGGAYERVEGTVDDARRPALPRDVQTDGTPRVEPGPLARNGETLAVFFQ
jgi:MoxR-like ATPase